MKRLTKKTLKALRGPKEQSDIIARLAGELLELRDLKRNLNAILKSEWNNPELKRIIGEELRK